MGFPLQQNSSENSNQHPSLSGLWHLAPKYGDLHKFKYAESRSFHLQSCHIKDNYEIQRQKYYTKYLKRQL